MNAFLNPSVSDDSRLVERHLAGDGSAFREIVERHQGMVCALAYSACGDVARSEDVAQEVFVAAWRQLPQLREPAKLRGWLGGITRHLAHDALRRDHRTPTARADELSPDTVVDAAGPREHAIGRDEAALMWGALEGLPEAYREPMVLFYREGRSAAAVAAALEISEDNARQRLTRGRALLTERMAKLVEETLERSAPTPAFAGMVVMALPLSVGPAAIEAALGGGGTAAKSLATAGAIGSAAAKGGAVFKFFAAVAFLPAMFQGVEDFIKFNDRRAALTDAGNRRDAAKAFLVMNAGVGLFVIGVILLPNLAPAHVSALTLGLNGLWVLGALGMTIRAKCRMDRLLAGVPAAAPGEAAGFERRSTLRILGLPLFHIRLGTRPTRLAPAVKGWIAISDRRAVGGLFAFGPFAVAPVSMGIVGAGLISVSVAALGLVGALGIVAAGWWSAGFAAAGGFAAKAVFGVAPMFTSGASAWAAHAGDAAAKAFFPTHWFFRLTSVSAGIFIWAGLLGWVMPVVLTGWQLWRTRRAE